MSWFSKTLKSLFKSDNTSTNTQKKEEVVMVKPDWVLKLRLERYYLGESDTIGKLYAIYPDKQEGKTFICYILEDKVRNKPGTLKEKFIKVYGETAIPYGTYQVIIDYSNAFKKNLPHILNVPCYEGIRIHSGNTSKDSLGCLICGDTPKLDKKESWVYNSKVNFNKLMAILEPKVKEGKVIIEIVDETK